MVDPNDPSTVPAAAAEAKVSDQPQDLYLEPKIDDPFEHETVFEPLEEIDLNAIPNQAEPVLENAKPNRNLAELGYIHSNHKADPSEAITLNNKPPIAGLYAYTGPMKYYFFLIHQDFVVVGRDPKNKCALPPDGRRSDSKISRQHFELYQVDEGRWEVRCISKQGLIVNNQEIKLSDTALVRDQSIIQVGDSILCFRCSTTWKTMTVKQHLNLTPI